MAENNFEVKRPISFAPNQSDLKNIATIIENQGLKSNISNSALLRKAIEIAAEHKGHIENLKSEILKNQEFKSEYKAENEVLKTANESLKNLLKEARENNEVEPEILSENENLKAEIAALKIDLKEAETAKKQIAVPEPKPEAPKNKQVSIKISERMEKALLIRQRYQRSADMEDMAKQAVAYCINQPIGNLFTGRW